MMKKLLSKYSKRLLLLSFGLLLCLTSHAQEQAPEVDVRDLTEQNLAAQGEKALIEGNFKFAQAAFGELISRFTIQDAKAKYGELFGSIYFARGAASLQLNSLEDAKKDFETSIAEFPGSPAYYRAMLQLANAHILTENYQEAVDQLATFNQSAPDRDKQLIGYELIYRINAAANIGAGDLDKAKSYIEALAGSRPTANIQIKPQSGLVISLFIDYGKKAVEKNELEKLRSLIGSMRVWSVNRPHELFAARSELFKLAKVLERVNPKENLDLSFLLLSLIPQEQQIRDSIQLIAGSLPANHPQAQLASQVLSELDRFAEMKDPYDLAVILYQASLMQNAGDPGSALGVYQHLLDAFPADVTIRNQILFNAVTASVQSGQFSLVKNFSDQFFQEFPNDTTYGEMVRKFSLESIFYQGEYEQALELAKEVRAASEGGSEQAQISDFVLAGSYYSLGQIAEAQTAIDAWMDSYADLDSVNLGRMEYLSFAQLDITSRTNQWNRLIPMADAFLATFPDAAPGQRGQAYLHKATAQNRLKMLEEAVATLEEYKATGEAYEQLKDRALVLEGQVLAASEKNAEALLAWKQAAQLGEEYQNDTVAAHALYLIVTTFAEDEQMSAEAVAAFDQFMSQDKFKETIFFAPASISAINPLASQGRLDDALKALEENMTQIQESEGFDSMSELVNGYSQAFLLPVEDEVVAVQLQRVKELDGDLERIASQAAAPTLRAATLLETVDRYRVIQQDAEDGSEEKIESGARVNSTFVKLDQNFDPKELNPEAIFSLAEYLFLENELERALDYFEAANQGAISQNNRSLMPKAAVGLGYALLESGQQADSRRAVELFSSVNEENYPSENSLHGKAIFGQAKAAENLDQWQEALGLYRAYLDGPWNAEAPQASFHFAQILQLKLPEKDKAGALEMYSRIVALYPRDFLYSIPSLKFEIDLRKELNQDQQIIAKRLDTIVKSYGGSMQQAELLRAGYSPEQSAELLLIWSEINKMHEENPVNPE